MEIHTNSCPYCGELNENELYKFKEIEIENINKTYKIKEIETKLTYLEYENENKSHKIKTLELDNENKTYKIKELETEIKELKTSIVKINNRETMTKIINSIQDLNSTDKLEKTLNIPYKQFIRKIRGYRNSQCHYILEDDSNELKNKKKQCILQNLTSIPKDIKTLFEQRFGYGLIDEIVVYLQTIELTYNNLTTEEIEDANSWWLD
jgi:uncharacterized protein YoxC